MELYTKHLSYEHLAGHISPMECLTWYVVDCRSRLVVVVEYQAGRSRHVN